MRKTRCRYEPSSAAVRYVCVAEGSSWPKESVPVPPSEQLSERAVCSKAFNNPPCPMGIRLADGEAGYKARATMNERCQPGLIFLGGVCSALPPPAPHSLGKGAACESSASCQAGLSCEVDRLMPEGETFVSCDEAGPCLPTIGKTAFVTVKTCKPTVAVGAVCDEKNILIGGGIFLVRTDGCSADATCKEQFENPPVSKCVATKSAAGETCSGLPGSCASGLFCSQFRCMEFRQLPTRVALG